MKIIVKGGLRDLLAFFQLSAIRKKKFRQADPSFRKSPKINDISAGLHPDRLELKVDMVREETPDTRTYRLVPQPGTTLPVFRSGQYLSLKLIVGDSHITRPYSISSTPEEALVNGYIDITVRVKKEGFATPYFHDQWREGTRVTATGPHGQFIYEPIRDGKKIACIAGGCGITPYKPLIGDILKRDAETSVNLLYGITDGSAIIFRDVLEDLKNTYPNRFSYTCVNSGPEDGWDGERGFIDEEKIRRLIPDAGERAFFLCGPLAMYRFLGDQLRSFALKPGKIRVEAPGDAVDPTWLPDFPKEKLDQVFQITVYDSGSEKVVSAKSGETVLVALDKAGLAVPSECRSGECGYCRSRLDSGEVYVIPDHDGRRLADLKFGYFHPCSSYPLTDLNIAIPKDPLIRVSSEGEE